MAGRHHQCNEHELGKTAGHGEEAGNPSMLQSMALQRVGHDWLTEQQQQQELLGQMATLCLTV